MSHARRAIGVALFGALALPASAAQAGGQQSHLSPDSTRSVRMAAAAQAVHAATTLRSGQYLQSTNGRYVAVQQADGNFVVYAAGRPVWASSTALGTRQPGTSLAVQDDGNLVLYGPQRALWATDTVGSGAGNLLVMQDDGNLVLYGPRRALWATGTAEVGPSPRSSPPPASASPPVAKPPVATPPVARSLPIAPPAIPAPAKVVTPEQYGALGDGSTDDTSALQKAFDSAPAETTVVLTGIYAHRDVLHLRRAALHVSGPGTLLATDESRSSVWIEADNVLVDGLTIRTARTTQRWSAWEQMGVRLVGGNGITLRSVTVTGAAAAGVYVGGSAGFILDHVTVQNSRADGIHLTGGSHDGKLMSPTTMNTGDDGVAVVSYGSDGAPCHDITVTSPHVLGTTWGRGISVVGGVRINETDIDVQRTSAAGVYIGAEGSPWFTAAPQDVTVSGGTIVGANTNADVDHGAVLVLAGENGVTPSNITIGNLRISDTRASASRDVGVITYGTPPTGIVLVNMVITGGPRSAYQGNTPGGSYVTRGWVQDGVQLPDHA